MIASSFEEFLVLLIVSELERYNISCRLLLHSTDTTRMGKAGRPRQFLELYEDLVAKCDSKETADAEYKTYMLLAKVGGWGDSRSGSNSSTRTNLTLASFPLQEQGLGKDARLDDISVPSPGAKAKQVPRATKRSSEEVPHSRTKRQQVVDTPKHSAAAGISSSEKVRNVPTF
jgi:hypothetical protein